MVIKDNMNFLEISKLFGNIRECGFSENEIKKIINLSGNLPSLLIEYYKKYGYYDFNDYKWVLIEPEEFPNYFDKNYIIIARENQWTSYFGIKKKLINDNPPVYVKSVAVQRFWKKTGSNLKEFLEGIVKDNLSFYTQFGKNNNYIPKPRYVLHKTVVFKVGIQLVPLFDKDTIVKIKESIKDLKKDRFYPLVRIQGDLNLNETEFKIFVKGEEIYKMDFKNYELQSNEIVDNVKKKLEEIILKYINDL